MKLPNPTFHTSALLWKGQQKPTSTTLSFYCHLEEEEGGELCSSSLIANTSLFHGSLEESPKGVKYHVCITGIILLSHMLL